MSKRLKLEYMEANQLMPLEGNPRKLIDEDGVAKLKKLISKHGFQNPLQVYKEKNGRYSVLCGNHRFEAGLAIGLKEFPCFVYEGTREMATARAISDNKSATWTDWELPLLKDSLVELDSGEFDIELTGWTEEEMLQMFDIGAVDELAGEDDVPEAPDEAVTKVGDIYQLGRHLLMCGDSTARESVETLTNGEKVDLVFTDPPYNVDYKSRGKDALLSKGIKNDAMSVGEFKDFLGKVMANYCEAMRANACIYVCHPDSASAPKLAFEESFASNFHKSSTIIWVKQSAGMGWQDYRAQHEPILYGWKPGEGKHGFYAGRDRTTVWEFKRDAQASYVHPTQKPVALVEEGIKNSSKVDDIVLDLFGGSGSTLIAAEKLKRKARLMELDPKYCDVIVERYKNLFPGQSVELLNAKEKTLEEALSIV